MEATVARWGMFPCRVINVLDLRTTESPLLNREKEGRCMIRFLIFSDHFARGQSLVTHLQDEGFTASALYASAACLSALQGPQRHVVLIDLHITEADLIHLLHMIRAMSALLHHQVYAGARFCGQSITPKVQALITELGIDTIEVPANGEISSRVITKIALCLQASS
jgi:DNA-binding NtrC family response regulator